MFVTMRKITWSAVLNGSLLLPLLAARPAAAEVGSSKELLTPASFESIHRMIGLQPGEYRWDEIPWITSIWHARKKAAAEDKPILHFSTGGAGFNDPLGNC